MKVEFKKAGRFDYMGFAWFKVYADGKPVIKQGVHLAYKALDAKHASEIHKQIEAIKE